MCEILDIFPKDIHVKIALSVVQIDSIVDYLDHCVAEYNSKEEPGFKVKSEYVSQEFVPILRKVLEDVKREGGV